MSDHPGVTLSPDAVRAELARILASETFANAGRLSRFLKFIVERTLAGEGAEIKEYLLGVEVFDRGEQYDPRIDSIVRVEARRLRSKLDEYYATTGARDPVVISVARGSYMPEFKGPRVQGFNGSAVHGFKGSPRAATAFVALLAALIVLLISSVAWRSEPAAARGVTIVVLPFEQHSGTEADAHLASRLTDATTSEIARLRTVSVVSRTSARQFEGVRRPVREIAQAVNANVVLEGTVEASADRVLVTARLVDGVTDRKLWVEDFERPRGDIAQLARDVARGAAAAAAKRTP